MAKLAVCLCLVAALAVTQGAKVSPVQKVIELLDECKAKVQKDLDAEAKAMEEYTTFCDEELEAKGFAIKTAVRTISELDADIADNTAILSTSEDEIAAVGTEIAGKEKELSAATTTRETEHASFEATEKEMVESVAELSKAAEVVKGGSASFLQTKNVGQKLRGVVSALAAVVNGGRLDVASRKRLSKIVQNVQAKDDDDLQSAFVQAVAAPKAEAFESATGGIVETLEDMQKKAEDELSELRKKEMENEHTFSMIKQGLDNEMANSKEKLDQSTKTKATSTEKLSQAQTELVETKKTKSADEEYSASLKTECEETARLWDERQKSAKEEMGAITKAKEILASGVKVLVQVGAQIKTKRAGTEVNRWNLDQMADSQEDAVRVKVASFLKKLARQHRSFALAQLASVSAADPFGKVRGLIEEMITKLVEEANEEATHEAFCNEEMSKSKASKEEKTLSIEKHQARIDEADGRMAQLTELIKTLEAEIAEIDKSVTEATKVRAEENAEYVTASKDFRDSAEAVGQAIAVLKSYYEGAFLVQVRSHNGAKAPSFGSAKGDAGSSIISILEMSEEDFTTMLAETEETEEEAVKAYEKLTQENKVARATKEAEAKASGAELKSLKVGLENSKTDKASVQSELDAVEEYIEKLKPECESKAMSYEERKAAREAEIEGLKQALGIIEGKGI